MFKILLIFFAMVGLFACNSNVTPDVFNGGVNNKNKVENTNENIYITNKQDNDKKKLLKTEEILIKKDKELIEDDIKNNKNTKKILKDFERDLDEFLTIEKQSKQN